MVNDGVRGGGGAKEAGGESREGGGWGAAEGMYMLVASCIALSDCLRQRLDRLCFC